MSDFEDCIISNYENYDHSQFRVQFSNQKVFICGGAVPNNSTMASFRQRFTLKLSNRDINFVLAENFKDYFKYNNYPDLFIFEDDIAKISSVILVFLESPGSLVEFGMFITNPDFCKKLLIVVPSEEIKEQNSFIYLGPLEHIKRKHPESFFACPWPEKDNPSYNNEHIRDLIDSLDEKISVQGKTQKFSKENPAHISFLIAEIIRLSYPIILDEIQYALMALNIEIKNSLVSRCLYLLKSLDYIDTYEYSSYKYYYPRKEYKKSQFISWGTGKNGRSFDEIQFLIELRKSYILDTSSSSYKRQSALKQISSFLE